MHDFGWFRARIDAALVTKAERAAHPPVRRAMVATENPYGPALYLGAHACSVDNFEEAEGRAWIKRLMDFASNLDFVCAHRWQQGDVVVWDNRAVMHRAIPFASTMERPVHGTHRHIRSPATH